MFDTHKENLRQQKSKLNEKVKRDEKTYNENIAKAKAVFKTNDMLDEMTIKELTTICKPLKKNNSKFQIKKWSNCQVS